jgi:GNAT superfamily N-acetyltransferase
VTAGSGVGSAGPGAGFVRPARAADAASVARVQVASWRCEYSGVVPEPLLVQLTDAAAVQTWQERWRAAISNPPTSRHKVLLAVRDPGDGRAREVVGFASAGPATDQDRWPGTDAELYELRVLPERTGNGHGGRLLHAVVDTLVEDGFRTASTWTLERDTELRGFLEAAGWAPDGARADLDVGVTLPAIRLHTRISE